MSDVTSALESVWAKTHFDTEDGVEYWLPLWQHLDDAGYVAGRLWDEWLPPVIRDSLAGCLGGPRSARSAVAFLAGVHDVGKASPAFAVQARGVFSSLSDDMRVAGLHMPPTFPAEERRRLPHGLAGQVALEEWLVGRGWSLDVAAAFSVPVGGHHGVPPDLTEMSAARGGARRHLAGEGLWEKVRRALLERAASRLTADELLTTWGAESLPEPAQVILTGLVIVADWIASNPDYFPLMRIGRYSDPSPKAQQDRQRQAWELLAMPRPWVPSPGNTSVTERLQARFDLSPPTAARPVQEQAVAAAEAMDIPGLLVIEAPMGEGKTEAALLAAEVLAARSGAGGCFVALPTQATTDAMFSRVLAWLGQLPGDGDRSTVLQHGKAWMSQTFRDLRFARPPVAIAQDEAGGHEAQDGTGQAGAFVHRWTNGRKKSSLADFVVGTIDQLLFAGLKARHVALRHLGMARKVVVVDEVHAYDAYMNSYLVRSLEWLGAFGAPVILLSATLPRERRQKLFDGYSRGRVSQRPRQQVSLAERLATKHAAKPDEDTGEPMPTVYPAVTYFKDDETVTMGLEASGRRNSVRLESLDDSLESLTDLLTARLSGGGCALVVRNTVNRAQETAAFLADVFGTEIRLVHARFTGHDRVRNDAWLRARFGPPSPKAHRPDRYIVVGTQVVEQSLDIDFDLLVTDLAPMDLLLQRIGRLHRHARVGRPGAVRSACCVVTGVTSWHTAPPQLPRTSERIYLRHSLYRAAALVIERIEQQRPIILPSDIAPLVEAAYGDKQLGPEAWQPAMVEAGTEADRKREVTQARAQVYQLPEPGPPGGSLLGWLHADVGETDDDQRGAGRAQVRDGDDSVEVILMREAPDGGLRLLNGDYPHAGEAVPTDRTPSRSVAHATAGSVVRLPAWLTRGVSGIKVIEELEKRYYRAWQTSPTLEGQLVMVLSEQGDTKICGHTIRYDADFGLEVTSCPADR